MSKFDEYRNLGGGVASYAAAGAVSLIISWFLIDKEYITFDFSLRYYLYGILAATTVILGVSYYFWYSKILAGRSRALSEIYKNLTLRVVISIAVMAFGVFGAAVFLGLEEDGFWCLILSVICNLAAICVSYYKCKPI